MLSVESRSAGGYKFSVVEKVILFAQKPVKKSNTSLSVKPLNLLIVTTSVTFFLGVLFLF